MALRILALSSILAFAFSAFGVDELSINPNSPREEICAGLKNLDRSGLNPWASKQHSLFKVFPHNLNERMEYRQGMLNLIKKGISSYTTYLSLLDPNYSLFADQHREEILSYKNDGPRYLKSVNDISNDSLSDFDGRTTKDEYLEWAVYTLRDNMAHTRNMIRAIYQCTEISEISLK